MKQVFLKPIFLFIFFITLSCISVNACWCRKDPEETNTEEKFRHTISQIVSSSDFVFSGTLVEENDEQLIFKIENSWKGNAKDKITFRSVHNVTNGERKYFIDSCAYTFDLGKSYLVYADVTLEGLQVGKCGRTDFLTKSQRDVDELNRQKQISRIFDYNPTSFLF